MISDFITRKMKVFSAPDSVSQRSEVALQGLNDWTGGVGEYGAADAQIQSLNGKRLHGTGHLGRGMMIAVFDGGFMNVDKIPALHNIRLAGVKDFVVPQSKNIFAEMEHGTMVLSTMAANEPERFVGWRLRLNICWCAVKMSARESGRRGLLGFCGWNMLTVAAWMSSTLR